MVLAVLGGEPLHSALDAVVAVLDPEGRVACSGVLLGARHVLTAAHCAGLADRVAWGTDLVDGEVADERGVATVALAEGWTEGDRARDLAVLALDEDAPATPWPLAEGPPDPGGPLWIYGFGVTAEVGDTPGRKRGAELEVLEVGSETALSWNPSANACSGDSGGPAVTLSGHGWAVLGVQTWIEPACLGGKAGTTRADVWAPWLGELVPDLSREPFEGAAGPPVEARGCAHLPCGGPTWVVGALVALRARRKSRGRLTKPHNSAIRDVARRVQDT